MIVDANVHLAVGGADQGAPETWHSDWPPGQSLSLQTYSEAMDAAGIERAVLVTTIRRDGDDNGYTLESAASDAARYASVGNLDVLAPDALERLDAWAAPGLRGVRFHSAASIDAAAWLGDARAVEAWRIAERLGLVVSASRTRVPTIPPLRRIVDRFPEVPVVLYSAADPAYDESGTSPEVDELCTLAARSNVYLLLSVENLRPTGPRGAGVEAFLSRLCEHFGAGRIMWGSFSLFAGARAPVDADTLPGLVAVVQETFGFLSPSELGLVCGGTASGLYFD